MKICMIGLGSIGKRHLNNLVQLLNERAISYCIDACRSSQMPLEPNISKLLEKEYLDIEELPNDYDIIFITNPTALHYVTIQQVATKTKHMFIEKPIFEKEGYFIDNLVLSQDGIYYVACPLRHKGVIQYIKKLIEEGTKIVSARAISSSYLPDWRKDTDYRTVYSAKKSLGGGVSLDLIHEWDYLTYLFGMPDEIFNMQGHFSDLELDCDDLSIYMAKYQDKLVEVHLDYFGRKTERKLELLTNTCRMDVDLVHNTISTYRGNRNVDQELEYSSIPEEDFYRNEMNFFLDCIEGKKENSNSIQHAYDVLNMILEASEGQR